LEKIDCGSHETRGNGQQFQSAQAIGAGTNYTGDPNDSASMNVWLHKQVLDKNSGKRWKVPQELLG
jgi:hypothetical protein